MAPAEAQDRFSADPLIGLYWVDQPGRERWRETAEIESWLDDDQQLSELGRRAVMVMLGLHPAIEVLSGTPPPLLFRELLAADWLGA